MAKVRPIWSHCLPLFCSDDAEESLREDIILYDSHSGKWAPRTWMATCPSKRWKRHMDGASFHLGTCFVKAAISIGLAHRNLRSKTSMLAQVLQIFWGKEHLVKNRVISTLDKIIYYIGTFLQGSTKPLFTSQNRVETSWKQTRLLERVTGCLDIGGFSCLGTPDLYL
jgi:hypothetical protein